MAATAVLADIVDRAPVPPTPRTVEDTGLTTDQLSQLCLKHLYAGETSGHVIADRMRLPYSLLERIIEHARAEQLVEVRGSSGSGTAGFRYALTDLGRARARQYLDVNHYVGAAPVPLASYVAMMRRLAAARGYIERDRLKRGFSHLIIADELLEKLGPAVNAGKAVFLYGPPGNGKTVIADGMGRTFGGDMYVPYAVDIDGQIVTVFDPIAHEMLDEDDRRFRA